MGGKFSEWIDRDNHAQEKRRQEVLRLKERERIYKEKQKQLKEVKENEKEES